MIKHMEKESTNIKMGESTREIGSKTSRKDKAKRNGQMEPSMRDNTKRA